MFVATLLTPRVTAALTFPYVLLDHARLPKVPTEGYETQILLVVAPSSRLFVKSLQQMKFVPPKGTEVVP